MEPILQLPIEVPPLGSHQRLRALHEQLRSAILTGRLGPDTRLPPSRVLAESVGVSRNTVTAAYDRLLSEGYVVARRGSGTYVAPSVPTVSAVSAAGRAGGSAGRTGPGQAGGAASSRHVEDGLPDRRLAAAWRDQPPAIAPPDPSAFEYDFMPGLPDQRHLPFDVWGRLSGRALRKLSRQPAGYSSPEGRAELREAIAGHVSFTRAVSCAAEDVIVTAGAQQAFDLLARVLVRPGRTVVAVEDPGYPPFRGALASAAATLVPVPVDAEGLRVDLLPAAAKVVYVTPSHQFPLGSTMSMARRAALLEFARRNKAVVIEDDYDGEFRAEGRPLDALQTIDGDQSVFYVGTFSKSLFPALRLGFVVTPPWARAALVAAKQRTDWHAPLHQQDTLATFMTEGHLARHVRRMRAIYRERREQLLACLERECGGWTSPLPAEVGLHLSVRTDPGLVLDALVGEAAREGIRVQTIGSFASGGAGPDSGVAPGLVLGFGAVDETRIASAVRRLGMIAGRVGSSSITR